VKRVLLLTAGFGEGHNAAARNLREAFLAAYPTATVMMADVFHEAYGGFNTLCQRAYVEVINHLPALWQGVFEVLDRTPLVPAHIGIYRRAAAVLEKTLDDLRPEVVLSTYPGCNHLLDHVLRRRVRRPFRTVTVITDSLTVNSVWYRAFSDLFLVANEPTADVLRAAGVPASRIAAPGFPVPRVFGALAGHRTPPAPGEPWRVLYVVNSGRHLAPGILDTLLNVPDVRVTVTVGRDDRLGVRLRKVAGDRPVEIFGWTPEMPRLMAEAHLLISKAGGATVQEALAAATPMVITQIVPGQEEGNALLILENSAGTHAVTRQDIARTVAEAVGNNGALLRQWEARAQALGRPNASDEIVRLLSADPAPRDPSDTSP
jgi:processive 1,2-diacylglycerol beta-glucosyltransferase